MDRARAAAVSPFTQAQTAVFLTGDERERCRFLRATALRGKAVMERLQCTRTELDRWDRDGRLPHARLVARCESSAKVMTERQWFLEDVERVLSQIEDWRRLDSIRKAFRRRSGCLPARDA
jgi:hypothetical protein